MEANFSHPSMSMQRLLDLMAQLRHPISGCPWDLKQTFSSIAPYALEEAYEVVDAIDRQHYGDLADELGDLLLQVVFQSRLAEEQGLFSFTDVTEAIVAKLIRRHPHLFQADGTPKQDEDRIVDANGLAQRWDTIKATERSHCSGESFFQSIPLNFPSLTRALKVSRIAAATGFDWADTSSVGAKVREELDEVFDAREHRDERAVFEEMGDLLFCVANLARWLDVDPEAALRHGVRKFEKRFEAMASELRDGGGSLDDHDLDEMEAAWRRVKLKENK